MFTYGMIADIYAGPLLRDVNDIPQVIEAIAKTPEIEIYRAPMMEYELDPIYIMITNDDVLTTFGETGLVATIEKIDKEGNRHVVVERD